MDPMLFAFPFQMSTSCKAFSRGWDMHNRDTALDEVVGTQHQQLVLSLVLCVQGDKLHSTVRGRRREGYAFWVKHQRSPRFSSHRFNSMKQPTVYTCTVKAVCKFDIHDNRKPTGQANGKLNREKCLFVQGRRVLHVLCAVL